MCHFQIGNVWWWYPHDWVYDGLNGKNDQPADFGIPFQPMTRRDGPNFWMEACQQPNSHSVGGGSWLLVYSPWFHVPNAFDESWWIQDHRQPDFTMISTLLGTLKLSTTWGLQFHLFFPWLSPRVVRRFFSQLWWWLWLPVSSHKDQPQLPQLVPSGKHTKNDGKSPFIVIFSMKNCNVP